MLPKQSTLRVARPTDNLDAIVAQYINVLGLEILGQFENHEGFNGVILGNDFHPYHFEFTHHMGSRVGPAPTQDNLLVFYISDLGRWQQCCVSMTNAGFRLVTSYNPYWDQKGKTFEDIDGYRVVLQNT